MVEEENQSAAVNIVNDDEDDNIQMSANKY